MTQEEGLYVCARAPRCTSGRLSLSPPSPQSHSIEEALHLFACDAARSDWLALAMSHAALGHAAILICPLQPYMQPCSESRLKLSAGPCSRRRAPATATSPLQMLRAPSSARGRCRGCRWGTWAGRCHSRPRAAPMASAPAPTQVPPCLSDLQSPCQLPHITHWAGSCLGCEHVGCHACQ